MYDIKLNSDGDIEILNQDISLCDSVVQNVIVRLKWIYGEWRLGNELGFQWFEEVWVKNPNLDRIKSLIRAEITAVDGVSNAQVDSITIEKEMRSMTVKFTVFTSEEIYRGEVELNG